MSGLSNEFTAFDIDSRLISYGIKYRAYIYYIYIENLNLISQLIFNAPNSTYFTDMRPRLLVIEIS